MTKTESARSIDELMTSVATMSAKHPESAELKRAFAKLMLGRKTERKLYALPILGIGLLLFGAYLGISSGDISAFGIFAVLGVIVALSFFPARLVFRWEARNAAQKTEKLLAEFSEQST